jgi:hypothetical protein
MVHSAETGAHGWVIQINGCSARVAILSRQRPYQRYGASLNMTETTFILVRTDKSRGGGDDDYDVCDGDKAIGRIVRHPQAPMEAPWFWVIIAQARKRSLLDRGYAVSREQALAEFRARWILNDLVCPRIADLPTPSMPAFIARCVRCNAQIWAALNSPSDVRRICSRCARDFSGGPL